MAKIKSITAREILDSRGNPTIEVSVILENGIKGIGKVPSGASTGAHEALELRDRDKKRYKGKGVLKACENVTKKIAPELIGHDAVSQQEIDAKLIELDGTENKSRLGANAILGVSLACLHAAARALEKPLYEYISAAYGYPVFNYKMPIPMFNILNGGAHAGTKLNVQEFMVVPFGVEFMKDQVRAGAEIFHVLKDILKDRGFGTGVGDEGGFAPDFNLPEDVLDLISTAIKKAGYNYEKVGIALDVAASEFYGNGGYNLDSGRKKLSYIELVDVYRQWGQKYPIISIEDALHEDDWEGWTHLTSLVLTSFESRIPYVQENNFMIVGDDLFVTNINRLRNGVKANAANAILIKLNQIGTVTETIECIKYAQEHKYKVIISHRSGETADTTIADLAVAAGAEFIKTGAPSRGERVVKYNRLMEIAADASNVADGSAEEDE